MSEEKGAALVESKVNKMTVVSGILGLVVISVFAGIGAAVAVKSVQKDCECEMPNAGGGMSTETM